MRKQQVFNSDSALLAKIEKEFAHFCQNRRYARQRCPDEIRHLVFTAIDSGHSIDKIGKTGISTSAIRSWLRERQGGGRPKIRELRIVPTQRPPVILSPSGEASRAVVRIGTKIVIDIPVLALTSELIASLAAAAAGGVL